MVNINLLPWREYDRAYRMKALNKMFVLAILLVIFITLVIHEIVSLYENAAHVRFAATNKQLNLYRERNLKRDQLVRSALDNKNLQQFSQNTFSGKLFFDLGKSQQMMACFTGIERFNKTFIFAGNARSMTDLTEFLRHWNAAYVFTEIQIKLIEEQENGLVRFGFQAIENS